MIPLNENNQPDSAVIIALAEERFVTMTARENFICSHGI